VHIEHIALCISAARDRPWGEPLGSPLVRFQLGGYPCSGLRCQAKKIYISAPARGIVGAAAGCD
jgi:hypothetical protein